MHRIALTVLLCCLLAILAAAPASAIPPLLASVDQQNRHVTATFSAPRADDVTVYIASSPALATDGHFLQENIVGTDFLTDDEIQSGRWLAESQTDPGSYYVMLSASRDFSTCQLADSSPDPACADGMSSILPLVVPAPVIKYTVKTELLRNINILYLTLKASPLGAKQPYQVCWKIKTGRKKCVKSTLNGYSWNSDTHDMVRISTKGLAKRTKFTWTATGGDSKRLATKTIATPTSRV